jgi:hypothetical protein
VGNSISVLHNKDKHKGNMDKKTIPISNKVVRGKPIKGITLMAVNSVFKLYPADF